MRTEDLKVEEDIPSPVGLRIVARRLGVAYETVRYRIKMRQWDALPDLYRTGPRGEWRCTRAALDEFIQKMRGGAR